MNYKRLSSFLIPIVIGSSFLEVARGDITFKENDPGVWYFPAQAPLATTDLSCKKPGSSLVISQTVTRSIEWNMETGVTAGVGWGPVSAELSASFGLTIGASSSVTVTATITPIQCYSGTVTVYAAYQKKIFNVVQGTQTRQVAVLVPTGGVAKVWTNLVFLENCCPECGDGGGGASEGGADPCIAPEDDLATCGSVDPDLPADCDLVIPTVSEWGLIVMLLLALTAGTIVFARRRRPAVA